MVSIAPMWTPDFEAQLQLLDRRDRRQGERYLRAGQVRIEYLPARSHIAKEQSS